MEPQRSWFCITVNCSIILPNDGQSGGLCHVSRLTLQVELFFLSVSRRNNSNEQVFIFFMAHVIKYLYSV